MSFTVPYHLDPLVYERKAFGPFTSRELKYGGIGFVMKGPLWDPDRNWGYIRLNSPKEVTDEYEKYAEMLYKLIGRGFSAGVYTQTTDVEMEVNGLMTYDRKEMKVEPERIRKINQKLCNALGK